MWCDLQIVELYPLLQCDSHYQTDQAREFGFGPCFPMLERACDSQKPAPQTKHIGLALSLGCRVGSRITQEGH